MPFHLGLTINESDKIALLQRQPVQVDMEYTLSSIDVIPEHLQPLLDSQNLSRDSGKLNTVVCALLT